MHTFCAILGIVVLGLGLVDVFLTVLNYDESGFIATPLCALQWRCLPSVTRRLPPRWRPVALRQVTGLNIVLSMTIWIGLVTAGYGLFYYSQMHGPNFQYDGRGLGDSAFSAMYFSAGQLSTVGASQISPETDTLRALSILETLTGVGLITLILTFLIGVYQVVRDLRALSSNFVSAGLDIDNPVASLGPYLSRADATCLDSHLRSISESFWSYADGLRQHHLAYFFQSGRDQFSLPYVMHVLSHWLGALRWGLPTGHAVTLQPLVLQLNLQFEQFADTLRRRVDGSGGTVRGAVPVAEFLAAYHAGRPASDPWLDCFLRLNLDMARHAGIDLSTDVVEAYERYRQWSSFAQRAKQITTAVSWDLDYQPLMQSGAPPCLGGGRLCRIGVFLKKKCAPCDSAIAPQENSTGFRSWLRELASRRSQQ